jgi:hypothetical protein
MSLTISLLRPDDLLVLDVEAVNLNLDTSNPKHPMLVVTDGTQPAYLVINFQPQCIADQAFFETDPKIPKNPPQATPPPGTATPTATPLPTGESALLTPGDVGARIADSSRLVFQLPANRTKIPFQMEALLNWAGLELVVSAVAAVPDNNTYYPGLAVTAPAPLETALELPYRLILSPTPNVGWEHSKTPVIHSGRSELWHTRIARLVSSPGNPSKTVLREPSEKNPIPLRAIWSPDFVDHQQLPSHALDTVPFLSSMSPRDRAQIVILTSGFNGYYTGDPTTGAQQNFIPRPIHASRLFLSAMGAWLKSRGDWWPLPYYYEGALTQVAAMPATPSLIHTPVAPIEVQPKQARKTLARTAKISAPAAPGVSPVVSKAIVSNPTVRIRTPVIPRGPIQALDLTEWVHLMSEGRDEYVRIVYEGYLYPFGHRASLIKVSERKVTGGDVAPGGSPVAYLYQRIYIVVREQDKTYSPTSYQYAGREMPFMPLVHLNTRITPDLDFPHYLPGSTASFWITVGGANSPFPFHFVAQDIGGSQCDFHCGLIFVGDSETNLGAVPSAYAGNDAWRKCVVRGYDVTYADPTAGDTTIKTTALYFNTEFVSPENQTNVQTAPSAPYINAPFVPWIQYAGVRIPSLEELLGISPATTVEFYASYLQNGLDPYAGVFVDFVGGPIGVEFAANKSGGFACPNLLLTALSARKGLISGTPKDAAAGFMNPAEFFSDVKAELFGTIPLGNLIPVNSSGLADANQNAPLIRTQLLPDRKSPQQAITRIQWQPQLQNYTVGPVTISFNADGTDSSELVLNVKIIRNFDGSSPTCTASGKLTNFQIELLGVIGVVFDAIDFSSENGSKTNVTAHLANQNPIQFEGPLSFVQKLADILPPGLFGGVGPAIDLGPTSLTVSYTLGLPPIGIGVFSLENIAIMAGLELPYLDGKPGIEFGFASRAAPFLLTIECLGGGGFVHVLLTADGIQMVEGALEFGGEFSLDLGVASGGVHIMAGIYFQLAGTSTTLTGFVDIGGEVSVLAIISVSIDLNLSLSWISTPQGNKIQGRATLSISVSVMFFSISVSVSVERSFGSGSGDPKVSQLIDAEDWHAYALAFA